MCRFHRRHLHAWLAACACRGRSAAICSNLPVSAIPTCRVPTMIHPRPCCHCVNAINGPAYVLDRTWSARRWNTRASRLFTGWLDADGERNLLRYIFLRPEARSLIKGWNSRAQRVVAEFRAAVTAYSNDPEIRRLVDELSIASTEFERCWATQGVLAREGGERVFNHATMGMLYYQQVSLSLAGWPDYRLTMLIPAPRARN
jgi:transcription regulator MmyB-like protein